jgi:DNA polymerase/3'-5' exonuclease PolX
MIALQKGYTMNEYGIYKYIDGKKGDKIIIKSEKEAFDVLGIKYLEPHERELN